MGEESCEYADAGRKGASRGGGRGQGNFELAANYDYIHEGQRTLAKVYVGVGFQSLP